MQALLTPICHAAWAFFAPIFRQLSFGSQQEAGMHQNTQDKTLSRSELLQSIVGHVAATPAVLHQQPLAQQGYEIYTGLDYSIKTTVTTNTISARNA